MLVALLALMYDWFGLLNGIAMMVSVLVQWYLIKENRDAIDRSADGCTKLDLVKVFVSLSDGHVVTIHAPRSLEVGCFLTQPIP